jgi:hypothetical protein
LLLSDPRIFTEVDQLVDGFDKFSATSQTTPGAAARTMLSATADMVTAHEQRSALGRTAGNKFREVARTTENPTTKLLAEGLTHLAEGVRELDHQVELLGRKLDAFKTPPE